MEISVIIPNYNYGKYIEECIHSVINSDFDHSKMEIVVVDDASTDNSVELINKLKKTTDIHINLVKHTINSGLANTRNTGVKNATGKYLFLLDSDNYINKDCLKKHYAFLKKNKDYSACYAPIQKFDDATRELKGVFSNEPFDFHRLVFGNYIDAMAMIKKDDLIEVGFYDEHMPCSGWEDYDLWLRMGHSGKKIYFIEGEPLTQYRVHADSMINTMPPTNQNALASYIKTKYNIKELENINTPLTLIIAQVFYSNIKFGFSEEKSMTQTLKLDNELNKFGFHLPPSEEHYNFIRLDLGNAPGLINIDAIEIKSNTGALLWQWDKYTIDFKGFLFFFKNEGLWPGKTVQLSTWIDPHFMVSTNESVKQESQNGITVEVSLSSLSANQFEALSNLTMPFSNISENTFKDIQQRNNALSNDINNLAAEFSASKSKLDHAEELNTQIKQTLQTTELLNNQLINDKTSIAKEVTLKNDIIEQMFAEKGKNEILLSSNTNVIEGLKKDNQYKENAIAELNLIKNNLETTLSGKNELVEELKKNSQIKENTITELGLLNNNLETTLLTKQELIEELKKNTQAKENTITELSLVNNNLETTLSGKNELIEELKKNTQNKENTIIELTLVKTNLETTLSTKQELIEELKKSNQIKENTITELSLVKNNLETTLLTKQELIETLKNASSDKDYKITEMIRENNKLETALEDSIKTNNILNENAKSMENLIKLYEEKYVKSSLFRTIINKLKKN